MKPITEQANPKTKDIDRRSTLEIITLINEEDKTVAHAVSLVLDRVAEAVDRVAERLGAGGRLFYAGTGTSGRLGVLDASECPPTYGVSPDLVRGIIAGGYDALHKAVEGAEDNHDQAARDLDAFAVSPSDAVVAVSASGNTPYTLGALQHAKGIGAAAIAITCNPDSRMASEADISIAPVVGPEIIAGSSRMKAGTAQKMILNMISTATMIRLGLVYGNLMSNLQAKNEKLVGRACAILTEETGIGAEDAARVFEQSGRDLRIALLMARLGVSGDDAAQMIESHGGSVRRAIDERVRDEG
jgi:N-acetylmuramic acid 6-phosphate etherase